MSVATTIYVLFVMLNGPMPNLTPMASFQSEAACVAARDAVSAAVADADEQSRFLCFSSKDLQGMTPAP